MDKEILKYWFKAMLYTIGMFIATLLPVVLAIVFYSGWTLLLWVITLPTFVTLLLYNETKK